jgi:DNA processing protein
MDQDQQIAKWLDAPNHHIIESESDDFPELLRQIPGPPTLLYVVGNKDALHLPALAVVGSRNPTRGGIQNAYDFSNHLARSGFCIVSGLAQGIDTAAHKGALDAGAKTVAFLGHGIDRVYPAENRELAHRIAEDGALCSEYPLGSPPRGQHFPQGSLISARLASEQGREIFAIPGSIHNPLSRGCHQLIKQGAKLVESADDIVSELAPLVGHLMQNADKPKGESAPAARDDADYQALLSTLSYDPASADQLAEYSGLTIDQVSSMLLILELEGKILVQAGGRYSRPQASDH